MVVAAEPVKESRFVPLLDVSAELLASLNKIDNYKRFCAGQVSECDKSLSDIDHVLELTKLNAVQQTQLIGKRKEILHERRFYKDEIARADVITRELPRSQELHSQLHQASVRLQELEESLDNREYTPRVLFDLFGWDEADVEKQRQRREDLTRYGEKHAKKNLALEEKFRQIQS